MLVRVFEIPPPSGKFHFGGGEMTHFAEVDWFRDDPRDFEPDRHTSLFHTEQGRKTIEEFIRHKHYFDPTKAYLVLHPTHSFTIGYKAP